jgi:carboxyl-terminal processing protease
MPVRKQISAALLLIVGLVTLGGWVSNLVGSRSPDYYHDVERNLRIFGEVYKAISDKYVEEVDPNRFMRAGIDGMLATLDPYTVLIEKEDNAQLQIMTSGKYGGVGMRISTRNGWPTVVEPPFNGTPAQRAGIREGDVIIEVDGESTKGMNINTVASKLRGEVGTEVTLKISREGEEMPIEFRLLRAEIVIKDVAYAGIIRDGIGYIKLTHFSKNAGNEVEDAIRELKRQGMQSLILDLRSNPGGLLDAAVDVADNFLEPGELIVSTRGRSDNTDQEYRSQSRPTLGDKPLVVLVNGASASASEIVSGAVQDLDRGVIIGTRTFGKGLVQTVVPISRDAALKLTTAKYYIPSGRLIQNPERLKTELSELFGSVIREEDEEKEDKEEDRNGEEEPIYRTRNGRTVYGGGGIVPDIVVEEEPLTALDVALLRQTMPFNFAVTYAAKHPDLPRDFVVTDEILAEFRAFLKEKNFQYKTAAEMELESLKKTAEKQGYFDAIAEEYEALWQAIEEQKDREFERSKKFIQRVLEREIAAKLWGTDAEVEAGLDDDPVIRKAIEVLNQTSQYYSILKPRSTEG